MDKTEAAQYAKDYNRGWRYSATTGGLDIPDRRGWTRIEAWMDGYLDEATGRAKWHYRDCTDHTMATEGHGCGEA
jgi:hypothetical protein